MVPGNTWAEVHHLDLGAALIVVLMATGLVIVMPVIGRINVIAVEKEAILRGSAKIAQKN